MTYLLHEGLDRARVRKHLLVFCLAAPSAAIATFLLLLSRSVSSVRLMLSYPNNSICLTRAGSGGPDTIAATGLAMLFSAGTFLYVATVHVLPEVTSGGGHGHSSGAPGDKPQGGGFSKSELAMLILGAVAPLFLSIGHHH